MTETLNAIDQSLFFFLNGLHCSLVDPLMYYGTMTIVWIPLYLGILYLIIRRYKWQSVWIIMVAALMVVISDQVSNLVKEWVARPRPTHEPGLTGIHTLRGYLGGQYGFYSAHASTNLAIALFVSRMLKGRFRYLTAVMLTWAFFMAYTRIYLGVHYPGDILAGWVAGALIGGLAGRVCQVVAGRSTG